MKCQSCNSEIKEDARFCPSCGERQSPENGQSDTDVSQGHAGGAQPGNASSVIPLKIANRKAAIASVLAVVVVVAIIVVAFGFSSNKPSIVGSWTTELFSSSGMGALVSFQDETESHIDISDDGSYSFKFDEIDLDGTWRESEAVAEKAGSLGIDAYGYKLSSAYFLDGFIGQYGFLVTDKSGETRLIVVTEKSPENVIVYRKA